MRSENRSEQVTHFGRCHCGRVRFAVEAPSCAAVNDCNCSICKLTAYRHLIVPHAAFRLIQGKDSLTCYQFNTAVAKHYFCKYCGIKSFYVPRSDPDGISVNARCLEPGTFTQTTIKSIDGENWEQSHRLQPQNIE